MNKKIYTKTGDKGTTGTMVGRLKKSDKLPVALGTVDELNSWIGMCRARLTIRDVRFSEVDRELLRMQNNLLVIGSALAGSGYKIGKGEVKNLERLIDKYTARLPVIRNFIFPLGELQVARSVARRAEREVVGYKNDDGMVDAEILKYLNRVSDALFVVGRWVVATLSFEEKIWKG